MYPVCWNVKPNYEVIGWNAEYSLYKSPVWIQYFSLMLSENPAKASLVLCLTTDFLERGLLFPVIFQADSGKSLPKRIDRSQYFFSLVFWLEPVLYAVIYYWDGNQFKRFWLESLNALVRHKHILKKLFSIHLLTYMLYLTFLENN